MQLAFWVVHICSPYLDATWGHLGTACRVVTTCVHSQCTTTIPGIFSIFPWMFPRKVITANSNRLPFTMSVSKSEYWCYFIRNSSVCIYLVPLLIKGSVYLMDLKIVCSSSSRRLLSRHFRRFKCKISCNVDNFVKYLVNYCEIIFDIVRPWSFESLKWTLSIRE